MTHNRGPPPGWKVLSSLFGIVFLTLGVIAFGLSVYLMIRDKGNIRKIEGVPPINNEVFNLAGDGIAVIPSIPGNSIMFNNTGVLSNIAGDGISVSSATGDVTISNTGVLTVNGRSPLVGDILLSQGSGISIANGPSSNEIVMANTGVLSNIAGTGIAVSSATGVVTISNTGILSVSAGSGITAVTAAGASTVGHELTEQTLLSDTDASGPQVRYTAEVNGTTAGNWTAAILSIVDNGQGAVGSNAWEVPVAGLYDVRAHCTADNATDYQMIHAQLTLGGGYIIGKSSTGIPSAHTSAASVHVSGLAHAGCTGCPVAVGDALELEALADGSEFLMDCDVQVSRIF